MDSAPQDASVGGTSLRVDRRSLQRTLGAPARLVPFGSAHIRVQNHRRPHAARRDCRPRPVARPGRLLQRAAAAARSTVRAVTLRDHCQTPHRAGGIRPLEQEQARPFLRRPSLDSVSRDASVRGTSLRVDRRSLQRTLGAPARLVPFGSAHIRVQNHRRPHAARRDCRPRPVARPGRLLQRPANAGGGSAWGSNPPGTATQPHNGFEDRGRHRTPSTPALILRRSAPRGVRCTYRVLAFPPGRRTRPGSRQGIARDQVARHRLDRQAHIEAVRLTTQRSPTPIPI